MCSFFFCPKDIQKSPLLLMKRISQASVQGSAVSDPNRCIQLSLSTWKLIWGSQTTQLPMLGSDIKFPASMYVQTSVFPPYRNHPLPLQLKHTQTLILTTAPSKRSLFLRGSHLSERELLPQESLPIRSLMATFILYHNAYCGMGPLQSLAEVHNVSYMFKPLCDA